MVTLSGGQVTRVARRVDDVVGQRHKDGGLPVPGQDSLVPTEYPTPFR